MSDDCPPEVTGRRGRGKALPKTPNDQRDAWSIDEFCTRNSISRSTYYNIRKLGQGPRETRVMSRVLITRENAAAWRRKQEKKKA